MRHLQEGYRGWRGTQTTQDWSLSAEQVAKGTEAEGCSPCARRPSTSAIANIRGASGAQA